MLLTPQKLTPPRLGRAVAPRVRTRARVVHDKERQDFSLADAIEHDGISLGEAVDNAEKELQLQNSTVAAESWATKDSASVHSTCRALARANAKLVHSRVLLVYHTGWAHPFVHLTYDGEEVTDFEASFVDHPFMAVAPDGSFVSPTECGDSKDWPKVAILDVPVRFSIHDGFEPPREWDNPGGRPFENYEISELGVWLLSSGELTRISAEGDSVNDAVEAVR